jgi:NAD(P)-dependent dehydrogenase (short-subunit alcohol dehydrogenase family)
MTGAQTRSVAVVTGAGGAIGAAIARRLSADGWAVAWVDREADIAATVADQASGALGFRCDVSSASDVAALAEEVRRSLGEPSLLVNAAGIFYLHDVVELTTQEFDEIIGVNLRGPFLTCQAFIPGFISGGGGNIINIASTAALGAGTRRAVYAASKAGVVLLTRSIAVDYGPQGVRANSVCPGLIDTPMARWLSADSAAFAAWKQNLPAGRIGTVDDVASAVAFLASPESEYMHGTELVIDGGGMA